MIYVLGDSFSNPGYGATPGHAYVTVLDRLLNNAPIWNLGVSGGQVADLTGNLCTVAITGGDKSVVELGTNDHLIYKTDPVKKGYFVAGLQSVIAYLATPTKCLGKNVASGDMTGNWVNTPSFGIGKMGQAAGSTLKFHVAGTVVYLGGIQFDGVVGEFTVAIDGVSKGTFEVSAPGLMTNLQMPCGQRLYRFDGLADGTHEVLITMTGGQYIYAEWCAGNAQAAKPPVYVCNITKLSAACYAAHPPLSDATVADYNALIALAVSQLQADGLNIIPVDVSSVYFPDVDTYGDGLHPNDTGHAKIAMRLYGALG